MPLLKSWVVSANSPETDFPLNNLPLGVFTLDGAPRCGVAIGAHILDATGLEEAGLLQLADTPVLDIPFWNEVMELGPEAWDGLRARLTELLREGAPEQDQVAPFLHPMAGAEMHMPLAVAEYTDFYAGRHHATNVGTMFRGAENALPPNWLHIPIGYNGRASSVVVSGTEIRRPWGQVKKPDEDIPRFAPSARFDLELEMGAIVGTPSEGPISVAQADEMIFGYVLLNDWSARDIQKWEYQPLGPFLAKSFASTVSPFIVTMDALAPFRCPAEERGKDDPKPLPHLHDDENQASGGVDMTVEVWLRSAQMAEKGMEPVRISRGGFRSMYWTPAQMLAHHASNGCNMAPGDLLGSGTVSGPEPGSRGCLLEMTWDGRDEQGNPKPRRAVELPTGEKRIFLQDGDEVILRGFCDREGYRRIGLGECRGKVLPAAGG